LPFLFPSKVFIHFGKPIHFDNDVYKEQDITERVNIVKDAINELLKEGLAKREAYKAEQKESKKQKK